MYNSVAAIRRGEKTRKARKVGVLTLYDLAYALLAICLIVLQMVAAILEIILLALQIPRRFLLAPGPTSRTQAGGGARLGPAGVGAAVVFIFNTTHGDGPGLVSTSTPTPGSPDRGYGHRSGRTPTMVGPASPPGSADSVISRWSES
jgi:hypothetical protein